MKKDTVKFLYARACDLANIKRDVEFIQYLTEMFTSDDNGIEYPENLKLTVSNNKVVVSIRDYYHEGDLEYTSIGAAVKCNWCGMLEIDLFDKDWDTRWCPECDKEITQVGDCKNIDW